MEVGDERYQRAETGERADVGIHGLCWVSCRQIILVSAKLCTYYGSGIYLYSFLYIQYPKNQYINFTFSLPRPYFFDTFHALTYFSFHSSLHTAKQLSNVLARPRKGARDAAPRPKAKGWRILCREHEKLNKSNAYHEKSLSVELGPCRSQPVGVRETARRRQSDFSSYLDFAG